MVKCRNCGTDDLVDIIDLGTSPLANGYLSLTDLQGVDAWAPLRVLVCRSCWLVQTLDIHDREDIFKSDYAYFSSTSSSWVSHAEAYVDLIVDRLELNADNFVVEIAANDGYLLQFVDARGIPCLGIEPTAAVAEQARLLGLEIVESFLGIDSAKTIVQKYGKADLVIANNVLAHVPDLDDFIGGLRELLSDGGTLTIEFPTVRSLVDGVQFDTIYHEHFSYFSLKAVMNALARRGLAVVDLQLLETHGGSLRIFAELDPLGRKAPSAAVKEYAQLETACGVDSVAYYSALQESAMNAKTGLLEFLIRMRAEGKTVVGYGAAAKGNTLLNYAGVRSDLLAYVVDKSPSKIGTFLPGSRIPVVAESNLSIDRPDFILILPWNLKAEIEAQLAYAKEWGAKFVTAIPTLAVA